MIQSLIFLPANFTIATQIEEENDKAHIAALASMRLNFLTQEMQIPNSGWGFPFIQLFLITRILSPWIRKSINWAAEQAPDKMVNSIAAGVDHGLTSCEKTMDKVVDYLDPFLMAATTITYIALLALGHSLVATIGLTSIALIALQRFDYLPPPVAQALEPLGLLSMVVISTITPTFLIIRILCIAVSAMDLLDYLCRFIPTTEASGNEGASAYP